MQTKSDCGDAAAPTPQQARSLQTLLSRGRQQVAILAVGLTVAASVLVVFREPWHGPILFTLSTTHGVDTGDLLVLPLVALALVAARSWLRPRSRRPENVATTRRTSRRSTAPIAAIGLGGLLLGVGVTLLADGTALRPAGGGTFDGANTNLGSPTGLPVRQWSHVAVSYDGTSLRMYVNGVEVARQGRDGEDPNHIRPVVDRRQPPVWRTLQGAHRRTTRLQPCPRSLRDRRGYVHSDRTVGWRVRAIAIDRTCRRPQPRGRVPASKLAQGRRSSMSPGTGTTARSTARRGRRPDVTATR